MVLLREVLEAGISSSGINIRGQCHQRHPSHL